MQESVESHPKPGLKVNLPPPWQADSDRARGVDDSRDRTPAAAVGLPEVRVPGFMGADYELKSPSQVAANFFWARAACTRHCCMHLGHKGAALEYGWARLGERPQK